MTRLLTDKSHPDIILKVSVRPFKQCIGQILNRQCHYRTAPRARQGKLAIQSLWPAVCQPCQFFKFARSTLGEKLDRPLKSCAFQLFDSVTSGRETAVEGMKGCWQLVGGGGCGCGGEGGGGGHWGWGCGWGLGWNTKARRLCCRPDFGELSGGEKAILLSNAAMRFTMAKFFLAPRTGLGSKKFLKKAYIYKCR